ncbi:MAG: PAS domain S-box protein [Promethearchaeota archaeon]
MTSTFESYSKIGQIFSENIDDLIFIINGKNQCEYINFEDFTSKRNFNEFIHPDDLKGVNRLIKNIYKTGFGVIDAQIKYKGNPFKWFEVKGKSFRDNEDDKKKVLLICREITKFKDLEFKMQRSQARFGELADYVPEIQFWKLLQTREGKSVAQKTREMLELVLDNIPQLIYWKDTNLVYMGCNKNFALLNHISEPTSIIGSTDEDIIWIKDNVKSIKSKENEVMKNNSAEYNTVESMTLVNGKQTWFEINRIPLHDPKGGVVGILVTYEDITIREIAEQKLKESEEKYRGILENIKETYFEVDLEGNFTFFNDAFVELIGYSKNELLNSNYQNFVDKENKDKIFNVYSQVFSTSKPQSGFQYQFKKKNGALVTCESSVYLSYDSEGNKIGFNGLARDITEKYILQQKIKESEEKYRTIFNASPDYIFITDTKGNILDMNPALLERIGTTLNEVRGINFSKFYVGENLDELRKIGELIISGKEIKGVEIKAQAYSGEIFEYEVNSVPLKENGKVQKILNLARDITLRKQAEQKLKESEKKYRHLFESSPYAIWLMDEEGVIVDCNSTMNDLLSTLEIKDLIGRKFSDVLSVLKRSDYLINILKNRFKRFLTGEKLGPLEFQITRVDGTKIWLSITSSLVNIGDQILTQAIIQNITDKKNAEQKIKESETKYRHLFEKSPYSIILINRKGKIIDCNPVTEKLFNRKIETLINKNFLDLNIKPEKTLPLLKDRYQYLLQGIIPEPLEVQIAKSQSGSLMWINVEDSLVEIGDETVFQVIIQDITEKKRAEEELKNSQEELRILNRDLEQKVLERTKDLIKSEQQYRTTINSLSDPLHVIDKNLNIILANSAFDSWLRNLDIDKKIVGLNVFDAFPFLPDEIHEEYKLVFESGETLITEGSILLNTTEIFTETRKIPIFSENRVNQVITIIRDITESKKMENQLIESEKNFRNMITNLDEGYYMIQWEGNILYHNPAFCRIAGYDPNENLIGQSPPFSWQKPEDRERYDKLLQQNGVIRNYIVPVKKKKWREYSNTSKCSPKTR